VLGLEQELEVVAVEEKRQKAFEEKKKEIS
jgi:hypothetical protein